MQGDTERQKRFMETHVPQNEDFRDMVRDHYRTAIALGDKDGKGKYQG